MSANEQEMNFLENLVSRYVTSEKPQDRLIKTLAVRTFAPYMSASGDVLEFGCSDGFMTSLIAPLCKTLTVVDGSRSFLETTRKRMIRNVELVHSMFEDYKTEKKYDYIFATYVLEHVQDAVGFLKLAGSLLAENGLLFVLVPNARAFSRQLARHMGLLQDLFELTPNDLNHGHRRVYDRIGLTRDIEAAGLRQMSQGGLLLKVLADFQMDRLIEEEILGREQQEGLYKMGLEYPDLAGSIFAVCRKGRVPQSGDGDSGVSSFAHPGTGR